MGMENDISEMVIELKVTGNLYLDNKVIKGVQTTTWGTYYLIEAGVLKEFLAVQSRYTAMEKSTSYIMSLVQSNKKLQVSEDGEKLQKLQEEVVSLQEKLRVAEKKTEVTLKELSKAENYDIELLEARDTIERLQERLQRMKTAGNTESVKVSGKDVEHIPWEASKKVRAEKRDKVFAVALSLSLRNLGTGRISEELKKRGYGSSGAHIARALSVLKDGDKERLRGIITSHPEEFEGISDEVFEAWFADRYKRLKKTADIRAEKAVKRALEKSIVEEAVKSEGVLACVDEWGEPIASSSEETGSKETPVGGIPVPASVVKPRRKPRLKSVYIQKEEITEKTVKNTSVAVPEPRRIGIELGEMPGVM